MGNINEYIYILSDNITRVKDTLKHNDKNKTKEGIKHFKISSWKCDQGYIIVRCKSRTFFRL